MAVRSRLVRVRAGMRPDDLSDQAITRAEPLPEELAVERGGEDRRAAAVEILRDSEERVVDAVEGNAPADAATERRHSEETT
ncbi:hypothetical protein ACQPZQ_03285 [Pseudonocardia sp. CA-142604]|uniref:hypothetical protein n=1 Tax=Pseudonocardia sp. CA-142604 TaxID=3240024 RepID=UPI003D8CC28D